MTIEETKNGVECVKKALSRHGEDEAAHAAEDGLYTALLIAIAAGTCADPQKCAQEALVTKRIAFSRWCG